MIKRFLKLDFGKAHQKEAFRHENKFWEKWKNEKKDVSATWAVIDTLTS